MAHFSQTFAGVVATGTSTAMEVTGLFDKWVNLENLSAGTIDVQVSRDNTTYKTVASRTAATDWVELPQRARFVRLVTTGVTGTVATLEADNPRGD